MCTTPNLVGLLLKMSILLRGCEVVNHQIILFTTRALLQQPRRYPRPSNGSHQDRQYDIQFKTVWGHLQTPLKSNFLTIMVLIIWENKIDMPPAFHAVFVENVIGKLKLRMIMI